MLTALDTGLSEVGPRLTAMNWYVGRRTIAPFFVIGDQPVAPSPGPEHPRDLGVGIGPVGVEVIAPLAPDRALVLKDEPHGGEVLVLPAVGSRTPGVLPDDWAMLFNAGHGE